MSKSKRGGMDIRSYCKAHEQLIRDRLAEGSVDAELVFLHERRLLWVQHEHLVHLVVTALTAVLLLFSIGLFVFLYDPFALGLVFITMALTCAFLRHYFFLESTVYRWLVLYDDISIAKKTEQLQH
jgi:hypothetical protein